MQTDHAGLTPPKGGEWLRCSLAFPLARDLLFDAKHLLIAAILNAWAQLRRGGNRLSVSVVSTLWPADVRRVIVFCSD